MGTRAGELTPPRFTGNYTLALGMTAKQGLPERLREAAVAASRSQTPGGRVSAQDWPGYARSGIGRPRPDFVG
jgi:hypothetical protein